MAGNFKSASLRCYFLAGYDGDKEMKISKVYTSVSEDATIEILEEFKNHLAKLTALQILATDVIVTKTV